MAFKTSWLLPEVRSHLIHNFYFIFFLLTQRMHFTFRLLVRFIHWPTSNACDHNTVDCIRLAHSSNFFWLNSTRPKKTGTDPTVVIKKCIDPTWPDQPYLDKLPDQCATVGRMTSYRKTNYCYPLWLLGLPHDMSSDASLISLVFYRLFNSAQRARCR